MPVVVVERSEDVAVIRLCRPEVRNAAGTQTWPELLAAVDALEQEGCRAAVLVGQGGTFCSGGDLKDDGAGGLGSFASHQRVASAHVTLKRIRTLSFPVIAAVEGHAVGIGWSLALACDFVVAAEDAVFAAPFLGRGVPPDGGGWWRLQRALGTQFVAELLLSGRSVSAQELHGHGLVAQVTGPGAAESVAVGLSRSIVRHPAETVALSKRLLREGESLTFDQALDTELMTAALNAQSGYPEEGRRAFLEHREPDFTRATTKA
ncbi:MAG: enoyl-CoA hydratase/carnithine racemase [Marmoricola sp.]|nr:enoyl-CoA hydratase/carnithine racemase [Marmoricola sp.]